MDLKIIKNHKFQSLLALVLLILTMLVLEFAESYSYYLMEVNTRPAFPWLGEVTSTPYSSMWSSFSIGMFAFQIALFSQPFLAILVSKNQPKLRACWLFAAFALFTMALLTIGSGGDRKGCVNCLGVYYIYFLLLPLPVIGTIIYVIVDCMKYKQR